MQDVGVVEEERRQHGDDREHKLRAHEDNLCLEGCWIKLFSLLHDAKLAHQKQHALVQSIVGICRQPPG